MAAEAAPVTLVPVKGRRSRGRMIVSWLTTTDHKKIGHLYLITSFAFFLIGGALAMAIRAELARPGLQFLSNEQYNQAFTMHGTIMLLLFATPTFAGFANAIMPDALEARTRTR
ncbi:cbb3-type cytochrome c oxidase subunit I [Streptomyces sp. NPDC002784]